MKKLIILTAFAPLAMLPTTAWAVPDCTPQIQSLSASGPGLANGGSFSSSIDTTPGNDTCGNITATKVFGTFAPITITFTVQHATGQNKFHFHETITNNTDRAWSDFHFVITEAADLGFNGNGDVFTSFQQSTLTGFTLQSPSESNSGPRELDFIGFLAIGGSAVADFDISPFDPGSGKTYEFQLTQTPTADTVNVPEPTSLALLGTGLMAFGLTRRRRGA